MDSNFKLCPTSDSGISEIFSVIADSVLSGEASTLAQITKKLYSPPTLDNFYPISQIGSGSFGRIFKVKSKSDEKVFAIKILKRPSMGNDDLRIKHIMLEKNIGVLAGGCDFILSILGTFRSLSRVYFLLPLMRGNLAQVMTELQNRPSTREIYAFEILEGVKFLQSKLIVHADLKPSNILITETLHVKIADFGLSVFLPRNDGLVPSPGNTLSYAAPEQLPPNETLCINSDLYSYACVVFEMHHRQLFPKTVVRPKTKLGNDVYIRSNLKMCCSSLKKFLIKFLHFNPFERSLSHSATYFVSLAKYQSQQMPIADFSQLIDPKPDGCNGFYKGWTTGAQVDAESDRELAGFNFTRHLENVQLVIDELFQKQREANLKDKLEIEKLKDDKFGQQNREADLINKINQLESRLKSVEGEYNQLSRSCAKNHVENLYLQSKNARIEAYCSSLESKINLLKDDNSMHKILSDKFNQKFRRSVQTYEEMKADFNKLKEENFELMKEIKTLNMQNQTLEKNLWTVNAQEKSVKENNVGLSCEYFGLGRFEPATNPSTKETTYVENKNKHQNHLLRQNKKHSCDICHKSFASKNTLKIHKFSVHSKQKQHTCGACGKSFSRKDGLKSHLKTHKTRLNKKDFAKCPMCNRHFRSRSGRLYHTQFSCVNRKQADVNDTCQKT